jgi:hypothetical protein
MTIVELRADLAAILSLEEHQLTDWRMVEARCLDIIDRLNSEPEPSYPHDVVYRFLDDADVRQKDAAYAANQRTRLREWLAVP